MKEFFQESSGKYSMTRLLSFLCVIAGLVIAVLTAVKMYYSQPIILNETVIQPDYGFISAIAFLVFGLLGLAFGGKVTGALKEASSTIESPVKKEETV